ncbi:MAG: type II toxin-antitoxin system MqsA family antitoxin [Deltaproteobacteria bacterium]|nr:type II toxin-antitoxin system MqsA family antitoxin [Kofleriaceae bacterium]
MTASGAIRVTRKAREEAHSLHLSPADVEDVVSSVSTAHFAERISSATTDEWMYVFRPRLEGKRLYISSFSARGCASWCPSMKTKRRTAVTRTRPPRRPAHELPRDACVSCGTMMKQARARLPYPVNGETILVPSVHLTCPRCGETVLELREWKRQHENAIAIYRERHGLLSADEIRAIRKQLGLNQAALARLLRLGGNTVSRWESGRNVQSGAMDILLRMLRDLPGSVAYLRKRAA